MAVAEARQRSFDANGIVVGNHRGRGSVVSVPTEETNGNDHLQQLRNITTRLLREDSDLRKQSKEQQKSSQYDSTINSKKVLVAGNNAGSIYSSGSSSKIQKLQPWVEDKSSKASIIPFDETSANQIVEEMRPSDGSMVTEHTATLCSALEYLSFENICGQTTSQNQKNDPASSPNRDHTIKPYMVIGHTPAEDDGFVVPREISFANKNICGVGNWSEGENHCCYDIKPSSRRRSNKKEKNLKNMALMKKLLIFKSCGKNAQNSINDDGDCYKDDNDTKVTKVKIYCDPPRPLVRTNSIEHSTLTSR